MRKKRNNLYPHQKEGVRRALAEPFFALFMDQGTGKTAVAIRTTVERFIREGLHRVVVFAPNNLLYNWTVELKEWAWLPSNRVKVLRLSGKKKDWIEQLSNFMRYDPELCTLEELRGQGHRGKKKDILKDNGVDASTVDGMKSSDELDSAMDATLNNNELKKESSDGEFILKIVDEDLDIDGYISEFNGKVVDITPVEGEAKIYGSEDEARKAIEDMCNSCHYDPETFTIMPKDDEDDDENWTALEDPEMSI